MFRTTIKNLESLESYQVEFFEDDTIDIVRQQISKSTNIHPDRLFIVIKCELSRHYYKQDKRNWDTLFHRLSLNGQPIQKEIFSSYISQYRQPSLNIEFLDYDRDQWMSYPPELKDLWDPSDEFSEYFILGVEDLKSYCLPFQLNNLLVSKILASQQPIPENSKLFNSFYSLKNHKPEFGFISYKQGFESPIYFPLLKSTTPIKLNDSEINLLDTNSNHLKDLLNLEVPIPKKTHILRATWYVELVDTQLEEHIRTRFEQMFYGLTLSPKTSCITFYTGSSEVSRHKFYTEDPKTKKPFLDLPMWQAWWTKSKPSRPRPTLVLYKGKSREHFDRISISATDITFAIYRSENEKYNLDDLRQKLQDWFETLDSIQPFIQKSDLIKCRWALQDIKFESKYSESLEELDTKRLKCLSSIFKEDDKQKTIFKFLRNDYAFEDLSSIELHIIDLLKDNEFLRPQDIQEELKISLQESTKLLQSIRLRIDSNPQLLQRKQRGFPILQFLPNSVIVANITNLENTSKYVNLLRYILSNPSSKQLDKICPKKVETIESKISVTNVEYDIDNEFGDLFGYLEKTDSEIVEEEEPEKEETKTKTTKKGTVYNYFVKRLEAFDPETFKLPKGFNYPKECEQGRQPVILNETELDNIMKEYDPRLLPDNKKISLDDPKGTMSCPEYWCMYDKIPLEKSQLIEIKGSLCCPQCNGKVQDSKLGKVQDTIEYSVIKRKKGQNYPGYTKYHNLTKDQERELPCCFGTPKTDKKTLKKDDSENKYYVLGETKTSLDALKFSFVSLEILKSLFIPENYELILKSQSRISAGLSGYFRVGLARVSETLPFLFKIKERIPFPYENVKLVLNCSFLATWTLVSDEHLDIIENQLKLIKPFEEDSNARKQIARLISGISLAYKNNKLTQLQELEYCALFLHIDIYRILIDTNKFGCTFFSEQIVSKKRALIVLQRGSEIDCLCHILRTKREFEYRPNLFESPFSKQTLDELNELRSKACHIKIPNQEDAYQVIAKIYQEVHPSEKLILDSFGRVQGVFIKDDIILPYKNTPVLAGLREVQDIFVTYSDIKEYLPDLEKQRIYLELAKSIHEGYEYQEDILDSNNNIVEILLKSGLRIPVKPEKSQKEGEPQDIITTIMKDSETSLTFGQPDEQHLKIYKNISYNSELFEFILFELTKDLQLDDYAELRSKLSLNYPTNKDIFGLLSEWFDKTTHFNKISKPIEFVSKIRKPCGQFKNNKTMCEESNMCGWSDNTCKIEIRDTISKKKLFNKLLNTLLENSKTRYMILDNRTTPFFSTILYLELPNEIIMTDMDLKKEFKE